MFPACGACSGSWCGPHVPCPPSAALLLGKAWAREPSEVETGTLCAERNSVSSGPDPALGRARFGAGQALPSWHLCPGLPETQVPVRNTGIQQASASSWSLCRVLGSFSALFLLAHPRDRPRANEKESWVLL